MSDESPNRDFFISYTGADREWAEWIAWQLEAAGYTTLLQDWDFRPGENFVLRMDEESAASHHTIAVLSEDYIDATFTKPEWAAAFATDPAGTDRRFIPVRIRQCDLRGLLRPVIYIDLVELNEEAAKSELLKGVSDARAKPQRAPQFPLAGNPTFPPQMPALWRVPFSRDVNFTGRTEAIDAIFEAHRAGRPAALVGLGGIGKTDAAVEYAYRVQSDHQTIWWVRAADPTSANADLASLCSSLGLPEATSRDEDVAVRAALAWLESNSGWLLIFDGADGPDSLLRVLPRTENGALLFTSRNPNWRGLATTIELDEWSRAESIAYLNTRTGATDLDGAEAIASALGDLPLALSQAAAFIEASGCSSEEYLATFRENEAELLRRRDPTSPYPNTVATTWNMSFTRIAGVSTPAVQLMYLLAHFAPDGIPRSPLQTGMTACPEPLRTASSGSLAMADCIAALRQYSLIKTSPSANEISLHLLVQAVIRDHLSQSNRELWCSSAVRVLDHHFPFGERMTLDYRPVQELTEFGRLVPHALIAARHATELDVAPGETAHLLLEVGRYLTDRGEAPRAIPPLDKALGILKRHEQVESLFGTAVLNRLGLTYTQVNRLPEAQELLSRAVTILEGLPEGERSELSGVLGNLGEAQAASGDWETALVTFERSLALARETNGGSAVGLALGQANYATAMIQAAMLDPPPVEREKAMREAEPLLDASLSTFRRELGATHPRVGGVHSSYAGLWLARGDMVRAASAARDALENARMNLPPKHPTVGTRSENLAQILVRRAGEELRRGNPKKARKRTRAVVREAIERASEAIAIAEENSGADHPSVGTALFTRGEALALDERKQDAQRDIARAHEILSRTVGDAHPFTKRVRRYLDL